MNDHWYTYYGEVGGDQRSEASLGRYSMSIDYNIMIPHYPQPHLPKGTLLLRFLVSIIEYDVASTSKVALCTRLREPR